MNCIRNFVRRNASRHKRKTCAFCSRIPALNLASYLHEDISINSGISRVVFLPPRAWRLRLRYHPCERIGQDDEKAAPSERITLGMGWGMQGPTTPMPSSGEELPGCGRLRFGQEPPDAALNKINGHYGNKDCRAYHDYREMMAERYRCSDAGRAGQLARVISTEAANN